MTDTSLLPTANVIAISGSLRKGSYNMAVLRAAQRMQPNGMNIELLEYADVPVYNGDVESAGLPASVKRVREQVAAADAILIATPEYNYSIPGVLKNVIDWMSRKDLQKPEKALPLFHKPLGIIGASVGQFGTTRAQLHLRQICVYTNMVPLNQPEVLISHAHDRFDESGELTDAPTRDFVAAFLASFLAWTRHVNSKWSEFPS